MLLGLTGEEEKSIGEGFRFMFMGKINIRETLTWIK
jgi:hypothetical protein